jgi:hypothetical protein
MARLASILVLIGLLTTGWFYTWQWGAGELQRRIAGIENRVKSDGGSLECVNRRVEGFPFRIGVFCDGVEFSQPDGGAFSVMALRSAAQFYDPGHLVAEIDGPASVQLPDATRFLLGWDLLRASVRLDLSGFSAFSVELRRPALSEGTQGEGARKLASGEAMEIHARKSPANAESIDVAIRLDKLSDAMNRYPGLSLEGDVELSGLASRLRPGFDIVEFIRENGIAGAARKVILSPDSGGRLALSGPFSVTQDGLLEGQIRIEASDLPGLGAFFLRLFPERAEAINNAVSLISAIVPDAGEAPGKDAAPSFTLTIRRGQVSLGLIPLGKMPSLF